MTAAILGLLGTAATLADSVRDFAALGRRAAAARIPAIRLESLKLVASQAMRHELIRLTIQGLIILTIYNAKCDVVLATTVAMSGLAFLSSVWDFIDRMRLARRH